MNRKEELQSKIADLEQRAGYLREAISRQKSDNEGYRQKLHDIDLEIEDYHNRNYNEWISNQNEQREDLGKFNEERAEYWDNRQQIQFYDKELSEGVEQNLKEGEQQLEAYQSELSQLDYELRNYKSELENLPPEQEQTSDKTTKEDKRQEQEEDDGHRMGFDYGTVQKQEPKKTLVIYPTPRRTPRDKYSSRRIALKKYAQQSAQDYQELNAVKGGYSARVGDTIYDYHNENDLVIRKNYGNPSVADFQAILVEEKRLGRDQLPMGNLNNPEYQARLVVACQKSGIIPQGNFQLSSEEIKKLSSATRGEYNRTLQQLEGKTTNLSHPQSHTR